MAGQKHKSLQKLLEGVPPGFLVDSAWLEANSIGRWSRAEKSTRATGSSSQKCSQSLTRGARTVRDVYIAQVRCMVRVLPLVSEETVFELKGDTAINLFYLDLPRKREALHHVLKRGSRTRGPDR